MSKTFADHILAKDEIFTHIELYTKHPEQKQELINLVEEIFSHHLLDTVLTHLPKNHHDEFLEMIKKGLSDPKILKFLKEKIEIDIEKEIRKSALKLRKELLSDIQKSGYKKK